MGVAWGGAMWGEEGGEGIPSHPRYIAGRRVGRVRRGGAGSLLSPTGEEDAMDEPLRGGG